MKKINYNLVTFIAAVTVMTSCKEDEFALSSQDKKVHNLMIKVREDAVASSTRTAITGRLFTWATDDSLGLYTVKTNNKGAFKLIGGQGTNKGAFSGNLTAVDELVYAAYPHADASTFTATTYTSNFVMSQAQNHLANGALDSTSIGEYALMFGQSKENVSTDITSTTDVNISMKHLTAIIDFKISDIPKNTVIRELNLKADSPIFPSKVEVNLSTGDSTLSDKKDNIKVALFNSDGSVGVNVGDSTSLTIRLNMLPTTVPENGSLIVSLTTGDANNVVIKSLTKNIPEGKIYEAGGAYDAALNYDTGFVTVDTDQNYGRPNVVIIYADDIGYGDFSCYNTDGTIDTPNVDALAANGIRFTQAHTYASTSTPSRYALFTGEYAFRHNITILPGDAASLIKDEQFTLGDVFKEAGYATGAVGKWHLGLDETKAGQDWNDEIKLGPQQLGFDYSYILAATADRVPCVYIEDGRVENHDPLYPISARHRGNYKYEAGDIIPEGFKVGDWQPTGSSHPQLLYNLKHSKGHNMSIINGIGRIGFMKGGGKALWKDEDMADSITNKAVRFIDRHKDEPFFLYFGTNDVHVPRWPHARFRTEDMQARGAKMGVRGAAILQFDWSVGEIVRALTDAGVIDNTLIILSSDNGPVLDDGYKDEAEELVGNHRPALNLRGMKTSIYEGGTRVPTIVQWKGRITTAKVSNVLSSQVDWIRSLAKLVNVEIPEGEAPDSQERLGNLLGTDDTHRPWIVVQPGGTPKNIAIRNHRWKYIPTKGELYNLESDIGEANNVIGKNAPIVTELKTILDSVKTRTAP